MIAINPLSPSIHIQILQTDLHTFPLRISWENLIKHQGIFSFVIIFYILTTLSLDNVWTLLGENGCWSLLGLKGLSDEFLCLHLDRVSTKVCAFKLKLKLIVTISHCLAYHAVQGSFNGSQKPKDPWRYVRVEFAVYLLPCSDLEKFLPLYSTFILSSKN